MTSRTRFRRIAPGLLVIVILLTAASDCGTSSSVDESDATFRACEAPGTATDEMLVFDDSSAAPKVMWATAVGDIDADEAFADDVDADDVEGTGDQIDGIDVDDDANTVISGVFHGLVNIGDEVFESRGDGDIFTASLTPDGTVRWAHQFGGTGDDNAFDLKVDGAGNIYLSGWFTGTVDFGGVELAAVGARDMFVAKLSVDGDTVWARSFGGPAGSGGNEIAVLPDGEIAVSAMTSGDFVVDGVTYPYGGGMRDAFVLRMDTDGEVRWVRHFDGSGAERIRAIAIARDGHVAVGFQFRGELRSGNVALASLEDWDGALARLTPAGDIEWVHQVQGAGTDNVRGAGISPDGSIYASGEVTDAVSMFERDVPGVGDNGDDYIAKLTEQGDLEWLVTFDGPGRGPGTELQANADGVIVSGALEGDVVVRRDSEVVGELESPAGLTTSYAAAFSPSGELRFVYTPTPEHPAGGALGGVVGVAFNGEFLVQAVRFRGEISIEGDELSAPANAPAVIFTCLRGP